MSLSKGLALLILLVCMAGCEGVSTPNPIEQENAKPGDPSWVIPASNRAFRQIEGYTLSTSVNRGGSIAFLVNTDQPAYVMKIYRMGWYGGDGARLLRTIHLTGVTQPVCPMEADTHMVYCKWGNPYTLAIPDDPADPTDWASGIYLAQLTQAKSGKQNYIPFIVRDDNRAAAINFVSGNATWAAYNAWGGYSLYSGLQGYSDRALKVSLNRPFYTAFGTGNLLGLGYEISSLRFLEREGYDLTYTTEVDLHENGSELLKARVAFFGGHTEYWTRAMRHHLQAAIDAGVSAIFTDADSIYWQTRTENDRTGTPDRVLVCYRDATLDPYAASPKTRAETTVRFRDPPVDWPEEPLLGVMFNENSNLGTTGDLIIHDASNWVFAGTGLKNGGHLINFMGPEVDSAHGFSPAGIQVLAESPFQAVLGDGVAEMTVYRAESGALVFDSGTSRFAYGLDDYRELARNFSPTIIGLADGTCPGSNPSIQQMARNLLSRMGIRK